MTLNERLGAAAARWVDLVTRAPRTALLLGCALSALSLAYTASNLSIDTDTVDMLSEELDFRRQHENFKREFPQFSDSLLLAIDGKSAEQVRDAAKMLVTRLQNKDTLFKSVYAPGLDEFFDRNGLLYLTTAELETLADQLAAAQPLLVKLAQYPSLSGLFSLLSEALDAQRDGEAVELAPLLERVSAAIEANLQGKRYQLSWQALMTGDAENASTNRQLIMLQARPDFSTLSPAANSMAMLRQLADEVARDSGGALRLRITGDVALQFEEFEVASRGALLVLLLVFALVVVTLIVALRSAWLAFATLLTLVAGLALTAGFAAAAVGQLNLISIAFAILYVGLGVDFAIHFCMRYQEAFAETGTCTRALQLTSRTLGAALLICTLTTAIGFYAFLPTAYRGIAELGLISGTGMFISLAASLTLLPALLRLGPAPGDTRPASRAREVLQPLLRHPRWILAIVVAMSAGAIASLPRLAFDPDPMNMRDPQSESVETFRDLMTGTGAALSTITVLAPDSASAQNLATRLSALDTVESVVTLTDFVPEEQDEKLAIIEDIDLILGPDLQANPLRAATFDDKDAIDGLQSKLQDYLTDSAAPDHVLADRLRINLVELNDTLQSAQKPAAEERLNDLQTSLLGSWPASLHLLRTSLSASPVDEQALPVTVTERWRSRKGAYRVEVFPREDLSTTPALERFVSEVRGATPNATGLPVIHVEAGKAVVTAFQQAFASALLVIGVLVLLLARDVRALLPVVLAGLWTCGAMVVLGIDFNFANIIALPLLFGIGVDSGIHMMQRMRGELSHCVLGTSTARAVFYSGLTTLMSFGSLSFSPHAGAASIGQVLTIGLLFILIATLIVLPALAEPNRANA